MVASKEPGVLAGGRTDGGRRRAAGSASPQTEWTWRSWLTCFLSSLAAGALMSSAAARDIIWSPRTVAAPGITNAAGPRGAGPATREEWPAGAALATNASFAPAARPTARRRAGSERATGLTPARMMDAMGVRCTGRGPTRHRQSRAGEVKRPPDIFSRNALAASYWSTTGEKTLRPFAPNLHSPSPSAAGPTSTSRLDL